MEEQFLNIKEAKELIQKYRSITAEQLNEACPTSMKMKLASLTGFGTNSCSLCKPVKGTDPSNDCTGCIYVGEFNNCTEHDTYYDIDRARTIHDVLIAISARADYIQSVLDAIEKS